MPSRNSTKFAFFGAHFRPSSGLHVDPSKEEEVINERKAKCKENFTKKNLSNINILIA